MEKQPAIKSGTVTCLCCEGTVDALPLDTVLYNGFGGWSITKNGQGFFQEEMNKEWEENKTLKDIEEMIGEDTESDFRAIVWLPLRGAEYQRHEKNTWVLIRTDERFA